jgi:hypothetical protein
MTLSLAWKGIKDMKATAEKVVMLQAIRVIFFDRCINNELR